MGIPTKEFSPIISIRIPEINKDQNLLKNYYYNIIKEFLPKSEKNTEVLKFVFDDIENFFIIINNRRSIIKYNGTFNNNIKVFETYIFQYLLSKDKFHMNTELIPILISPEDKDKIMQKIHQIEDANEKIDYYRFASTYLHIEDYYVMRITTKNEIFIPNVIQN